MSQDARQAEARAIRLMQRGRPRAALAVTTVGLCRDSNAAGLWLLRSTIHHAQREWDKALDDVEHAMTLVPLPARGQLVLADCYWFTGRQDLARLAYEHLLNARDQEPELYSALYTGLLRCGRRDLALRCCRVAVESNPDDHAAFFAMAHCMVALNYDAAYVASVLRHAVREAPDREAYRISLAIQLTRCDCNEEAYEHLNAASIEQLSKVACACSVRRLLQVCLQARDHERAATLTLRLNELLSKSSKAEEE